MPSAHPDFPKRLIEGEGHAAEVIRRALAEPAIGPSEQHSWRKLQRRRSRALPHWVVPSFALVLSAALITLWLGRAGREPAASLRPDEWAPVASASGLPAVAVRSEPDVAEKVAPPAPSAPVKPIARAQPEASATHCAQLARDEQFDAATQCYDRVARGSGMPAELALYEKARLEAKAMGSSAAALATLEEHRRRFPTGVLAAEVGMTKIELLVQLGQREQALSAIEQALNGSLGRERGGDLQVLRADLLAGKGDCSVALDAVAKARQLGVHPSRLAATERRCSPASAASAAPMDAPPSSAGALPGAAGKRESP